MATKRTLTQTLPYLLIILGMIGLAAAFIILYEKLHILANPNYKPSCSINPIISCGSVMSSKQGSVFGFPNPILGLIGFSVVITTGMALLAGAKLKRWFWLGLQAGVLFGIVFVHWLFYQSVYNIQALCPYCVVVWSAMIPLFWYTTLYNLRERNIPTPKRLKKPVAFMQKYHADILLVWFLIIIGLILEHFWYYWETLV